ncbi:MAG: EAL domain-containing protein, partial [Candidatus Electrothrix sp. ATG2]|nr:EAL domain-containing protein [Candidatus Electrothrix sp. ATG2]
ERQKKYHCPGVLIFIDLDRFKPVNDTVGHLAGDQLLINVSHIIDENVRKQDTVARFGGDEFAVIVEDRSLNEALNIANSIRQNIERYNFIHQKKSFSVTASLGIAPIGGINCNTKSTVDSADNACSLAKRAGRNRVYVANPEQHEYERHICEINWLPKIQEGLESDPFELYAQRIQNIESNEPSNRFEILVRIEDKKSGILLPGSFIPAAERFGLMVNIDRWVIKRVFSSMDSSTSLSINLSGQTVADAGIFDYIHRLQQDFNIAAEQITFEITECAAMHNIKKTIELIKKLKKKGFTFSLDDFGTGLSSFTFLKNLPVNSLKIDGTLIRDVTEDDTSYMMVKFINDIGHLMGLEIIAEYVENEKIMERVKQVGVDLVQGFHIHRPSPFLS